MLIGIIGQSTASKNNSNRWQFTQLQRKTGGKIAIKSRSRRLDPSHKIVASMLVAPVNLIRQLAELTSLKCRKQMIKLLTCAR